MFSFTPSPVRPDSLESMVPYKFITYLLIVA